MTRDEFVSKAVAAGLSDDDIRSAMNERRQKIGAFDDEQQPTLNQQPQPEEKSALANTSQQFNSIPGEELSKAVSGIGSDIKESFRKGGQGIAEGERVGGIAGAGMQALAGAATGARVLGSVIGRPIGMVAGTLRRKAELIPGVKEAESKIGEAVGNIKVPIVGTSLKNYAGAVAGEFEKAPQWQKDIVDIATNLPVGAVGMAGGKKAVSLGGKGIARSAEALDRFAGKVAQETSGASEQALRMAGTKEGRAALQAASNKEYDIGQRLVHMVDNADDYMPERQVVDEALKNMPPVKSDNVISALESAKVKDPVTAGAKNANAKIDEIISDIKNVNNEKPDYDYDIATNKVTIKEPTGELPASKFISIRRQLDNEKKAAFDKDYKDYVEQAVLRARNAMKNDLIDAAERSGNTQYIDAMKSWSDKIEKVERLKDYLGKNATTRANRAESFIQNLYGRNKTEAQRVLKDAQDIFGADVLGEAKMAQLANQIGEGGKAAWLPKWTTGRSLWSKGIGAVVGSPQIASRATLPITGKIAEIAGKDLGVPLSTKGPGEAVTGAAMLGGIKKSLEENKPKKTFDTESEARAAGYRSGDKVRIKGVGLVELD